MASKTSIESSLAAQPNPCTESTDVAKGDGKYLSAPDSMDNESGKGVKEKVLENSEALTDARYSGITRDHSALFLAPLDGEIATGQRRQRSASYGIIDNSTTSKKILNIWKRRAASSASLI